jgi:hypothetical protein
MGLRMTWKALLVNQRTMSVQVETTGLTTLSPTQGSTDENLSRRRGTKRDRLRAGLVSLLPSSKSSCVQSPEMSHSARVSQTPAAGSTARL